MPIWRRLRRVRRIVDMVDGFERKGLIAISRSRLFGLDVTRTFSVYAE